MKDQVFDAISAIYELHEKDIKEYSVIKGCGMKFMVKVYDAAASGNLCVMDMTGFGGLMKMETVVFSPTEVDAPMLSSDYIKAFGKETLLLELYDTTIGHPSFAALDAVKEKYAALPAHDPGEHWYDSLRLPQSDFKKGRKLTEKFGKYSRDYAAKYFDIVKNCKPCDTDEKMKKNAVYADGLLTNGGPAVNQFKKMIGPDKTEVFLKKFMFAATNGDIK